MTASSAPELTFAKGRTRKQVKATKDRTASALERRVRMECVARDEYCRFFGLPLMGACEGASEWAHLGEWRRARTRGLPPERRHHTQGSLMLCEFHHDEYDAYRLDINYGPEGANGWMTATWARSTTR